VVLDPFTGTGTTPATARLLGRSGIGIDVSPESCAIAEDRVRTVFSKTKRPKREDPAQLAMFGAPAPAEKPAEPAPKVEDKPDGSFGQSAAFSDAYFEEKAKLSQLDQDFCT
jgi:hypothetical protein